MAYLLDKAHYTLIRKLDSDPHFGLVLEGMIAGNTPGRIWVDGAENPRAALLYEGAAFFLVGASSNTQFEQDITALFAATLLPEAVARSEEYFKVHYASDDWKECIAALFPQTEQMEYPRVFYAYTNPTIADWRDRVPEGFTIQLIDRALLEGGSLGSADKVIAEIGCCWKSVDDFFAQGFGFWALHGDEIIGWCTSEYLSANKCGIGIETVEEYQGRGLAKLTASAFIEHSLAVGKTPHWDAWLNNRSSVAVAEKVGFHKLRDYSVILLQYTPAEAGK